MKKNPGLTRNIVRALILAGVIGAGSTAVAAEEMIGVGKDTFQFNLGFYRPNFTTNIAAGYSGSIPPGNINFENDLNLDKDLSVGRLDGSWRFAENHRIFFGFYDLARDSSGTLNKDIGPINIPSLGVNDTILAGSSINVESKPKVYILAYDYSFYKTDMTEISGRIGLDVVDLGAKITGTLKTKNHGTLTGATAGDDGVTAPLPVLGINGEWALDDRWRLKGHLTGFRANVADVDATVTDVGISTEYRMWRNFGMGVAYNLLRVSGDVKKSDYSGSASWRTGGWEIYGTLVF